MTSRGFRGSFTFEISYAFPNARPEIEQLQEWLEAQRIRFQSEPWGEDQVVFSFMSDGDALLAKEHFIQMMETTDVEETH